MSIRYNFERIEAEKNCKFIRDEFYKIRPLISDFSLNDKLFTFLIENNMNRYIFGYILGIKNLNLDFIPINEKLLSKTELMNRCGESFIKKYICPECGNLIFRKHIYDFKYYEQLVAECLNCGKESYFKYSDLEDDFEINRHDIIKFMDKVVDFEIFSKKHVISCNNCTETAIFNLEDMPDLTCPSCSNICEIKFKYESNFSFLTEGGFWFEWYVYNICKHLYMHVYPNYKCEYEFEDKKQQCEFDILAIGNNNEIIVFECKDYMRYNKNRIPLEEFVENISKINHIADEIYLVSSTKNIKDSAKIEINNLIGDEIKFIEGMDLEKRFLSEEHILEFFEKQDFNIVQLYDKLPILMKTKILRKILELMIENDKDSYIISLLNIFSYSDIKHVNISNRLWSESLQTALDNIYSDTFVAESLGYLKSLFEFKSDIFDVVLDLNKFISKGIDFLSPNSFVDFERRAPFYYFITSYFEKKKIDTTSFDSNIAKQFLLKFIPMLDVYYGSTSVRKTLNVFLVLWDYVDSEVEDSLVNRLKVEYKYHSNKRFAIKEFISKDKLTQENKLKFTEFINSV